MDNNIVSQNNNSNNDPLTEKPPVNSDQEKTQVSGTVEKYTPSEEITQKYNALKKALGELKMDNCCALINPEVLASGTFADDIRNAKLCFDKDIKTYGEPIERELEDMKKEMEHWEERKENDKRHLDSLLKAKKETDVSGPVNLAKKTIVPLFEELTAYFRDLAKKTGDTKTIKETYTKVISYIHNQPLDKKNACGYCAETNDAYHYIKEQFAKEDKWVKILEDQMLVSKLHTKNDHDELVLDGAVDKNIIEKAQKLHRLNFTFENELVFRTNDANTVYEDVKYAGNVINLDIFGEKTSTPKPYE